MRFPNALTGCKAEDFFAGRVIGGHQFGIDDDNFGVAIEQVDKGLVLSRTLADSYVICKKLFKNAPRSGREQRIAR